MDLVGLEFEVSMGLGGEVEWVGVILMPSDTPSITGYICVVIWGGVMTSGGGGSLVADLNRWRSSLHSEVG